MKEQLPPNENTSLSKMEDSKSIEKRFIKLMKFDIDEELSKIQSKMR
jgi:hypothetical protein